VFNSARLFSILLLLGSSVASFAQAPNLAVLRHSFQDPPADSRIMMRWWWFGPSVTEPELERELRVMNQGGVGGVEVQVTYPLALDDPEHGFKNVPYLSDSFIDKLRFASDKARELGMRFDLTLGSGWPYGGPHIPVTQAAGKLRFVGVPVSAGANDIPLPDIGAGEKLLAVFMARGEPTNFTSDGLSQISSSDIGKGRLRLPAALGDGPHAVLFFISSRTGMQVKRPALGAEGFVLDHFDREAAEIHLHEVGDRLMTAFGVHPPYAVFSDSLEVYASDWTGDLLQEFQRRRGYDLTPYLPALVQDIGPVTADIRHDWGITLTELIQERYLTPVRDWARQHHTLFRSQTYGIPAVSLSSNSLADLIEGEGEQWRKFAPTRWASSASHLFGAPITSSETWTWLHSSPFRATPLDMKAAADLYFLQGVNQLIGHGWPYSPDWAGNPGWRFYAAAAFDDHNPWWLVMPDVTRYLQRVSYVLRQGKSANDVALLLPTDDAWSKFSAGHDSVSEAMDGLLGPNVIPQILDAGFNLDFIDADAINKIGIPYPVLILPGIERLPLDTYQKIEAYVRKGGIVIATRNLPSLAPGLHETITDTPQVRELSQRIFQGSSAPGHFVADEHNLGTALASYLKPDVSMSPQNSALGFVHRKLPFADVYFLANTSNRTIHTQATFRVSRKHAEWLDPMSGKSSGCDATAPVELDLQPYESRVLVFSNEKNETAPSESRQQQVSLGLPSPIDLSKGWDVSFRTPSLKVHMDELRSWTVDEATKFYSGVASYEKTLDLPADFLKSGSRLYLDFGAGTSIEPTGPRTPRTQAWIDSPVREAAQVFVNGAAAGSVWHPPYAIEVTELLHAGENELRIEVGNLAINTLAGRAPADYRLLNSLYGERFVAQEPGNLQPLPSGILGPVRLVAKEALHSSVTK
jgi:alpha-L-rhamnosidase